MLTGGISKQLQWGPLMCDPDKGAIIYGFFSFLHLNNPSLLTFFFCSHILLLYYYISNCKIAPVIEISLLTGMFYRYAL